MRPIVNMPEKDRATDIFKMHKKLVKIALVVPEISSRTDRQTDRQTYSSQYFATALAGEVTRTSGYATWFTAGGENRVRIAVRQLLQNRK